MRLIAVLLLAALAACGPVPGPADPVPSAAPGRIAADLPLPLGFAEDLPAGYGPEDVYYLVEDWRGPGCLYYDVGGVDTLLGCVG